MTSKVSGFHDDDLHRMCLLWYDKSHFAQKPFSDSENFVKYIKDIFDFPFKLLYEYREW